MAMLDVENAQELAEQAGRKLAATTQEVVAEGRKRVGRKAKKRARKLERKLEHRVAEAAKRLPVDTPVDRPAVYLAWRARNRPDGMAESGPAPDAFGSHVEASDDGDHTSVTSPQP